MPQKASGSAFLYISANRISIERPRAGGAPTHAAPLGDGRPVKLATRAAAQRWCRRRRPPAPGSDGRAGSVRIKSITASGSSACSIGCRTARPTFSRFPPSPGGEMGLPAAYGMAGAVWHSPGSLRPGHGRCHRRPIKASCSGPPDFPLRQSDEHRSRAFKRAKFDCRPI